MTIQPLNRSIMALRSTIIGTATVWDGPLKSSKVDTQIAWDPVDKRIITIHGFGCYGFDPQRVMNVSFMDLSR